MSPPRYLRGTVVAAVVSLAAGLLPLGAAGRVAPHFVSLTEAEATRPAAKPLDVETELVRLSRAVNSRVLEPAYEAWVAAEKREPKDALVVFLRGKAALLRARSLQGNPQNSARTSRYREEARVKFQEALRLNPTHPVIQREFGYHLCRDFMLPGEGRPLLQQALKLRPEDPRTHYYLAQLAYSAPHGEQPNDQACLHHLKYALRDPLFIAPRSLRLDFYLEKKDPAGARKMLAEIEALLPAQFEHIPPIERQRRAIARLQTELKNKPKAAAPKAGAARSPRS